MGRRLRAGVQVLVLALCCWVFVLVLGNSADWPTLTSRALHYLESASSGAGSQLHEEEVIETSDVLVTRVIDGDTIEIAGGERVRYIGIDAPEERGTNGIECFAREASDANSTLVQGQYVRLEADTRDRDRYGRLLRYVWIDDQLINEVLVRRGFARRASYPPDDAKDAQLQEAEALAQLEGAGLWSACNK